MTETDIVERLHDLHKQATTERSHYYVGKCVKDAIAEIERLRALSPPAGVRASAEIPDAALNELAPGLFSVDHVIRHQTASPLRVEVAQAKVRERVAAFLAALSPPAGGDGVREALRKIIERANGPGFQMGVDISIIARAALLSPTGEHDE